MISGALATILVGRQTGGDLGRILEESASTLREMQRLEGVVRTKTAEGKSQAWVLGAIPFVLMLAIYWVDPNWLKPLGATTLGYLIIGVATSLWLSAILLARRILAVDV
jgi:tight adherence protein B